MDHIDKRAMWNIEGTYDWKRELKKFNVKYSEILKELHRAEQDEQCLTQSSD